MAAESGIGWTHGTVNFWIGCTRCGPGCDGCYAAAWSYGKWGIVFEPGGERRPTKAAFNNPLKWHRAHEAGRRYMGSEDNQVPVPRWIFCNSLSDFFDKEVPAELRARAWAVIKACHHLRWQIVTKRVGLVERYLPEDWNGGKGYEHVGIIGTMVNQDEINRDIFKLEELKAKHKVRWIGLSIEPQIGLIDLTNIPFSGAQKHNALTGATGVPPHDEIYPSGFHYDHACLDWVICGGESRQAVWERNEQGVVVRKPHEPRPYELNWAVSLIEQCARDGTPLFIKQMGDNAQHQGKPIEYKAGGKNPSEWAPELRVQQMPRIYDNEPARTLL